MACAAVRPPALSRAELLLARIAHARSRQRDGKNDQQGKKHAQVADSHDEGHSRTGKRCR